MKKGDLKKQDIIRTAEIRFCRDGYEKTSIQDILDDLRTSKGSFYHHFASKEALLGEICRNRAESTSAGVFERLEEIKGTRERLNALISGLIPFSGEKLNFLLMLIPVFSGPDGITIRSSYANELMRLYIGPVSETLQIGTEEGSFSCRDSRFFARMLIFMLNRFWMDICDKVLENEKNGTKTDPVELMNLTGGYRIAAERMLSAPYGSLNMIELSDLITLTEQIHVHWKT